MAPVHDTDLAEKRWADSEWRDFELWERIEVRLRRRRLALIGMTCALFLILSSVPILIERWPRWTSLHLVRTLGQEINRLKREASLSRQAYRLRVPESSKGLAYVVEKSESCSASAWTLVREGALAEREDQEFLSPQQGEELGYPGLVRSFCYDFLAGADVILQGDGLAGFAIIPVNDLANRRSDRISLLLLSGPSAEASFD